MFSCKMDIACTVALLLFFVGSALRFSAGLLARGRSHFNFEEWTSLDPVFLQQEWDFRRQHGGLFVAAEILSLLAWFLLLVPVMELAWILSRGGKRKLWIHGMMAALAMGGAIVALVSGLFIVGITQTSNWVSQEFNLSNWLGGTTDDDIGWRVLEIAHLIGQSLIFWVDAFEWLALSGILLLISSSIRTLNDRHKLYSTWWIWLGVVIAILAFLDFLADGLRLQSWMTFQAVAGIISFVNTLILLPIWLFSLARTLPLARPKYVEDEDEFVNTASGTQSMT